MNIKIYIKKFVILSFKIFVMKSTFYTLLGFLLILALASCSDKPDRPSSVLTQSQIDAANARAATAANSAAITPPASQTPEPPQNAAGVWHYTCSNGCSGGSGSATACATCGSTLVHNTIYHNTPAATTPIGATTAGAGATTAGAAATTGFPTTITPPVQQTPEPAQNAAGVWHYTCSSGCAGGAGSAIACATCGSTLVHNQGYH